MNPNHKTYYYKRAAEYEKIYHKPERQNDLRIFEKQLIATSANKSIIELGCGTGYWTHFMAQNCKTIFAIDINQSVIDIAKNKPNLVDVTFEVCDYYDLTPNPRYDLLFAGFIWSHIAKNEQNKFFKLCLTQIQDTGAIILLDNKYVEGSNTPISREDKAGNTYQQRQLQSGETYEVLKNFPEAKDFSPILEAHDITLRWEELDYYWMAALHKKAPVK